MAFSELYRRQVALLIRTLPLVAEEKCFALKGGTAINLFIRDMPRLSVDIDLTYVPVEGWPQSLAAIEAALKRIAARIKATVPNAQVQEGRLQPQGVVNKLLVRSDRVQTKIEVTPVSRGCVHDPQSRSVSPAVEAAFGFAEVPVVSFPDLYGGKIVAALDRQHPRDFFDLRDLLANEGIDDDLRRAFIAYLLSHNRPMAEVLAARRKDVSGEFQRGFQGMTDQPVTLEALYEARDALIGDIVGKMPDPHRRFLVSFERGEPDWALLGLPAVAELPAVKWRQLHLAKLDAKAREGLVAQLENVLFA
jgi:predicted nucleotidyltransferase component of viral defense system